MKKRLNMHAWFALVMFLAFGGLTARAQDLVLYRYDADLNSNVPAGGITAGFYGGDDGAGFFQNDPVVNDALTTTTAGGGDSGAPTDEALDLDIDVDKLGVFTFYGFALDFASTPVDATGATLTFSAKRGDPAAFDKWAVRLEDASNFEEFNNLSIPFTVTDEYQTFTIDVSEFLNTTGQAVDPTQVAKIVFLNGDLTSAPDPIPLDLQVDDVRIAITGQTEVLADYDEDLNTDIPAGGFTGGFYGGDDGAGFFQNDPLVDDALTTTTGGGGDSGAPTDEALDLDIDVDKLGVFTFYGFALDFSGNPVDVTGGKLSFKAKRGDPAAFDKWTVRLEDASNFEEFNNLSIPFTVTDEYQTFTFDVAEFLNSTGQVVDLTQVNKIAFLNGDLTSAPDPIPLDLQVDDIEIEIPSPPVVEYVYDVDLDSNVPAGGFTGGFYGGDDGAGFFQNDPLVDDALTTTTGGGGDSGAPTDEALDLDVDVDKLGVFTFYGFALDFSANPVDVTGGKLSFKAKRGDPAAFDKWTVRLEDASNFEEFNNLSLPFTVTDEYQTFSFDVAEFLNTTGQAVDPTQVAKIAFLNGDLTSAPDPIPLDLQLDDVKITVPTAPGPPPPPDLNDFNLDFETGGVPSEFSVEGEFANPLTDISGDHSLSVVDAGGANALFLQGTTSVPAGNAPADSFVNIVWTLDGGNGLDMAGAGANAVQLRARRLPASGSLVPQADFNGGSVPAGVRAFWGNDTVFEQDINEVQVVEDDPSGQPNDLALQWTESVPKGATFTFLGIVALEFTDDALFGGLDVGAQDVSGKQNLVFDAKLGSTAGAIATWTAKLEETSTVNGAEDEIALSGDLTTSWQTFTVPLSSFASVDLSQITRVVLVGSAAAIPAEPDPIQVDILIDNIRFEPAGTPASTVSSASLLVEDGTGAQATAPLSLSTAFQDFTVRFDELSGVDFSDLAIVKIATNGPDASAAAADYISNVQVDDLGIVQIPNAVSDWALFE